MISGQRRHGILKTMFYSIINVMIVHILKTLKHKQCSNKTLLICWNTAKTDRCMSLEINNRALVFQKTSALLLISSVMHLSVFAVNIASLDAN